MIRISDINGQVHYLAAAAIASISEAGTSSQWHGIRSFVKTLDGRVIEAQEPAAALVASIEQDSAKGEGGAK